MVVSIALTNDLGSDTACDQIFYRQQMGEVSAQRVEVPHHMVKLPAVFRYLFGLNQSRFARHARDAMSMLVTWRRGAADSEDARRESRPSVLTVY